MWDGLGDALVWHFGPPDSHTTTLIGPMLRMVLDYQSGVIILATTSLRTLILAAVTCV